MSALMTWTAVSEPKILACRASSGPLGCCESTASSARQASSRVASIFPLASARMSDTAWWSMIGTGAAAGFGAGEAVGDVEGLPHGGGGEDADRRAAGQERVAGQFHAVAFFAEQVAA